MEAFDIQPELVYPTPTWIPVFATLLLSLFIITGLAPTLGIQNTPLILVPTSVTSGLAIYIAAIYFVSRGSPKIWTNRVNLDRYIFKSIPALRADDIETLSKLANARAICKAAIVVIVSRQIGLVAGLSASIGLNDIDVPREILLFVVVGFVFVKLAEVVLEIIVPA